MKRVVRVFSWARPYWRRAAAAMLFLVVLVGLDLSIPRLIQHLIDEGVNAGNQAVVLRTSALMIAISLFSFVIATLNSVLSVQVGESVSRDLREAVFLKIQSFSYGDSDRFSTGKLMVRLMSDSAAVQRLVQISLRIGTRAPLLMIGSIILMFRTDAALALSMLPVLLLTGATIVFFSMRMEPLFKAMQARLDVLNTVLQENTAGVRLVKAFVRADYEKERFSTFNAAYTERSIRVTMLMSIMGPILSIFISIGMVLVIWAGGLRAIQGEMTQGEIIAFTNYLMTTMGPLIMMTLLSNVWAGGLASMGRIDEVLGVQPEIQDDAHAVTLPPDFKGRVEFEHVSFHYISHSDGGDERIETVLEDISFVAEPGSTVAILGATGAGKSTLVNLIPRFYDVSSGRVLVDGIDVRTVRQDSLISHVGIVPQETVLFSGTVAENISYGRPGATEEEIEAAAKAAQAHEFILGLPDGYQTHIEERGVNLSGGQKQRVAIARALMTRPRILILDDSTSAVDLETESRLQAAMAKELPGTTRFVVAQRVSTVLNADKILVLDRGMIAAEGTHRELLASSPIYGEIYDSQLGAGPQIGEIPETGQASKFLDGAAAVGAGQNLLEVTQ